MSTSSCHRILATSQPPPQQQPPPPQPQPFDVNAYPWPYPRDPQREAAYEAAARQPIDPIWRLADARRGREGMGIDGLPLPPPPPAPVAPNAGNDPWVQAFAGDQDARAQIAINMPPHQSQSQSSGSAWFRPPTRTSRAPLFGIGAARRAREGGDGGPDAYYSPTLALHRAQVEAGEQLPLGGAWGQSWDPFPRAGGGGGNNFGKKSKKHGYIRIKDKLKTLFQGKNGGLYYKTKSGKTYVNNKDKRRDIKPDVAIDALDDN